MEKKCCSETVSTDFLLHIISICFQKESPHFRDPPPTTKKSPRTVGACVWTAQDLEQDPSAWEHREATPQIVNCGGVLGRFGHT